uniref:SWIM-type domain-containing protein n=1 Tax=Ditylenchus dipsaci TaxID=166011 RepID=A0A915E9F9_9BILA
MVWPNSELKVNQFQKLQWTISKQNVNIVKFLRFQSGQDIPACGAFRQESIRSGYIYMLSEASVRSYIEVFESRRPAATLIGLITKIIAECNAHYSEKLMNYALGRNSEYGRQAHSIVRNSKTLRNEEQNAACSSMDSNDVKGSVCLVTDGLNQDGVEIRYLVNVSAGVCECHSSQTTFYCQHLDAAQTHLNCNVPSSDLTIQPELDKKERTLLLQLATGSSCSRSLFAPWDVVMSEESMEIYTDDADNIAQEILVDSSNSDQLHNYVIDKDNREDEENVKFYAASTPSTSAINGNTQTEDQPNKSTSHPKISATQYTKIKLRKKLAEQACVKLEKTRSVKAFQRFFTGVIDGNVSHTPCTSQVPPYQSLSPRKRRISEQKEVNEEDEFIIVEDNLQDADIQITTVVQTL